MLHLAERSPVVGRLRSVRCTWVKGRVPSSSLHITRYHFMLLSSSYLPSSTSFNKKLQKRKWDSLSEIKQTASYINAPFLISAASRQPQRVLLHKTVGKG